MEQPRLTQLPDDLESFFCEGGKPAHRTASYTEREGIRTYFTSGQYTQLEAKLVNYIAKYSAAGYYHEQFYLYYEVELARWRGEDKKHICHLAERALELTKPSNVIPNCRIDNYTYTELELLLTLIEYKHADWEKFEKSEICLLKIIQYAKLYFEAERCENIEDRAWQILLGMDIG